MKDASRRRRFINTSNLKEVVRELLKQTRDRDGDAARPSEAAVASAPISSLRCESHDYANPSNLVGVGVFYCVCLRFYWATLSRGAEGIVLRAV